MGVMLESEIRQDRSMSLVLRGSQDRSIGKHCRDLIENLVWISLTSTLRAPLRVWPAFTGS